MKIQELENIYDNAINEFNRINRFNRLTSLTYDFALVSSRNYSRINVPLVCIGHYLF